MSIHALIWLPYLMIEHNPLSQVHYHQPNLFEKENGRPNYIPQSDPDKYRKHSIRFGDSVVINHGKKGRNG